MASGCRFAVDRRATVLGGGGMFDLNLALLLLVLNPLWCWMPFVGAALLRLLKVLLLASGVWVSADMTIASSPVVLIVKSTIQLDLTERLCADWGASLTIDWAADKRNNLSMAQLQLPLVASWACGRFIDSLVGCLVGSPIELEVERSQVVVASLDSLSTTQLLRFPCAQLHCVVLRNANAPPHWRENSQPLRCVQCVLRRRRRSLASSLSLPAFTFATTATTKRSSNQLQMSDKLACQTHRTSHSTVISWLR